MNTAEILGKTKEFVQQQHQNADAAHDWLHISRVLKNAQLLAQNESFEIQFQVQMVALLHDLDDAKWQGGDGAPVRAKKWLIQNGFSETEVDFIATCISQISFSKNTDSPSHRVAQIVQDADRLDAIGAIGIARCFAYTGAVQRPFYQLDDSGVLLLESDKTTAIGHFYDKLLSLESKMNTDLGKQLAKDRTVYLKTFMEQLLSEI